MLTLLVSSQASIYCQVSSKLELGLREGCHEMLQTALSCAENDAVLKISQTQTQSVRFNAVLAAAVSTRYQRYVLLKIPPLKKLRLQCSDLFV